MPEVLLTVCACVPRPRCRKYGGMAPFHAQVVCGGGILHVGAIPYRVVGDSRLRYRF